MISTWQIQSFSTKKRPVQIVALGESADKSSLSSPNNILDQSQPRPPPFWAFSIIGKIYLILCIEYLSKSQHWYQYQHVKYSNNNHSLVVKWHKWYENEILWTMDDDWVMSCKKVCVPLYQRGSLGSLKEEGGEFRDRDWGKGSLAIIQDAALVGFPILSSSGRLGWGTLLII